MENDKIYVSSTCLKYDKIIDSVEELARNGFINIELSSGTKHYPGYIDDLLRLKEKYRLNYLLHNYFPPPLTDFVLNLASLNDNIYEKTIAHYKEAILLSRKLGSNKFGLHAGFFIDFDIKEIGKNISSTEIRDKDETIKRFCDGYCYLQKFASDVKLYIENNVLSRSNAKVFCGKSPFMLVDYDGYLDLKNIIDYKLLLDVAHLWVSANSRGINFISQLDKMLLLSDYVHLSDNDGKFDQNRCFREDNNILNILKNYDFKNKSITLETYGSIDEIGASYSRIKETLSLS
jgi:sugar phosphate isomerase/epimerase